MKTDGLLCCVRKWQVDRHELGEIMRAFGQKLSDEQVELMVRQADRDGDGQISCDE